MYYQTNYNLLTITSIINKYAPPVENSTGKYIADVSARTKVNPTAVIDLKTNKPVMYELVTAIIHEENGIVPYTPDEIKSAVDLAY